MGLREVVAVALIVSPPIYFLYTLEKTQQKLERRLQLLEVATKQIDAFGIQKDSVLAGKIFRLFFTEPAVSRTETGQILQGRGSRLDLLRFLYTIKALGESKVSVRIQRLEVSGSGSSIEVLLEVSR